MAKWGEGDPRWIVEEREDAKNVNNWHWTERDATAWSIEKIKDLLQAVKFEGNEGSCEISSAGEIKGEASANNRKSKLIFFYEWDIKLNWRGKCVGSTSNVNGEIHVPNLSEEHSLDDVDVIVTVKEETAEAQALKDMMLRLAPATVRSKLEEYLRGLREEYSQGMILPQRKVEPGTTAPKLGRSSSLSPGTTGVPAARKSCDLGCPIPTSKVSLSEDFVASAEDLYSVFTNVEKVQAFTRAPAVVEAYRGGTFSLFGGEISGEFIDLQPDVRFVQRWRRKGWPEGHYSTVSIEFKQETDSTKLVLLQTEVPDSDYDVTREGWKRHIFENIKSTFGYGAQLF